MCLPRICTYYIIYCCSYALIGENDAGKSVLLKCLANILSLDGGKVITTMEDEQLSAISSRGNIGYAPQV